MELFSGTGRFVTSRPNRSPEPLRHQQIYCRAHGTVTWWPSVSVAISPDSILFALLRQGLRRPYYVPGENQNKVALTPTWYMLSLAFDWRLLDVPLDTLDMLVAWRGQAGSSGTILGAAAALGKDGSVAMAGSVQESKDFSAIKLDADGKLLWEWQVTNTPLRIVPPFGDIRIFVLPSS